MMHFNILKRKPDGKFIAWIQVSLVNLERKLELIFQYLLYKEYLHVTRRECEKYSAKVYKCDDGYHHYSVDIIQEDGEEFDSHNSNELQSIVEFIEYHLRETQNDRA